MKKNILIAIFLSFFFVLSFNVNAQPTTPGTTPEGEGGAIGGGGGSAPVGSGLIFLLVLGAGYGAKKVIGYRKTQTD